MGDAVRDGFTPKVHSVVKAGSSSSPAVLSPGSEYARQLAPDACTASLEPLSVTCWSPPPISFDAGYLPLASPSEQPAAESRRLLLRGAGFSMADAIPGDGQPPTPPAAEVNRPSLRLPSFQALGIASPHPDHLSTRPQQALQERLGLGATGSRAGAGHSGSATPSATTAPFLPGIRSPFRLQPFSPLTPPEEVSPTAFTPLANHASDSTQRPSETSSDSASSRTGNIREVHLGRSDVELNILGRGPDLVQNALQNVDPWLHEGIKSILQCVNSTQFTDNQMRILSHALPSPSVPGHVFSTIINVVRTQLPPNPLTWINVFHAVAGRFNLADLPTSPPNTPGIPFGGSEDYFTTKIFDSAVPIIDYESEASPMPIDHPQPVVPPSSVNLSIVERFIPPASRREFADLFDPSGRRSILADRLVELSPNNGCLIFIYPTRTGAQTFLDEYLGPILDPILRSMVVVHGFSSNFSAGLGQMSAVDHLHSFSAMEHKLRRFCHDLSQENSGMVQGLHGSLQPLFTVEYAAKHEVTPTRQVWADWWVKQEKSRIRKVVNKYFATWTHSFATSHEISQAHLVQEILDGVKLRQDSSVHPSPMEIGIFVLKRQRRHATIH